MSRSLNRAEKWVRMVALNQLTGHSAGFFSDYTLPPNQAVSVERQLKINKDRGLIPPEKDLRSIILKKSKSLLSQGGVRAIDQKLYTSDASNTTGLRNESVNLTVTSPPFLDVVNYEADNWVRSWFLGLDPKKVKMSNLTKMEEWRAFVCSVLRELYRVTVTGGHIAFEVGEVRKGKIKLDLEVIKAAKGVGLTVKEILINKQRFTKLANCWG